MRRSRSGGGIWARSDVFVTNSTISHNYAEGEGGGSSQRVVGLVYSPWPTTSHRWRQRRCGTGLRLRFDLVARPGAGRRPDPADRAELSVCCRVVRLQLVCDASCGLDGPSDVIGGGDPMLAAPGRRTAASARPGCPAGEPGLGPDPGWACGFTPFGDDLEGSSTSRFAIDPSLRSPLTSAASPGPGRRLRRRRGRGSAPRPSRARTEAGVPDVGPAPSTRQPVGR